MRIGTTIATWAASPNFSNNDGETVFDSEKFWEDCPFEDGTPVLVFVYDVVPLCHLYIGPDKSLARTAELPTLVNALDLSHPVRQIAGAQSWPGRWVPLTVGCTLYVLAGWVTELLELEIPPGTYSPPAEPVNGSDEGIPVPFHMRSINVGYRATPASITVGAEVWTRTGSGLWTRAVTPTTFAGVNSAQIGVPFGHDSIDFDRILFRAATITDGAGVGGTLFVDFGQLTRPSAFPLDPPVANGRLLIRLAAVPLTDALLSGAPQ